MYDGALREPFTDEIVEVVYRLIAEFTDTTPAGVVIHQVAAARDAVLANGGCGDVLTATEALARLRLATQEGLA